MSDITVVFWKWAPKRNYRSTFTAEHVNIMRNMVARNTTLKVNYVCVTDDPYGIDPDIKVIQLWDNPVPEYGDKTRPNCYVRLKAFDESIKELFGEKFIWLDLDAVILGNIDHILSDPADFKMWKVDNEMMPCNGSLLLMKSGSRQDIWDKFDPKLVSPTHGFRKTKGLVGSDQAWIAQHLRPDDQFFMNKDGVYSFRCHIQPTGRLPVNARIVFFHGDNKPWTPVIKETPWIKENYR